MNNQARQNKTAWEHRAYEWWVQATGPPEQAAADMIADPGRWVRRHLPILGKVKNRHILMPLGSNGRKAVPLALLGAKVTIIDISRENRRYAMDLARAAGVDIEYILADYSGYEDAVRNETYDIACMEGGILHYFGDITDMFRQTHRMLKRGGRLLLDDFHPFRKLLADIPTGGDYFETGFHDGPVAYEKWLEGAAPDAMPKCRLRYWTMGEIVTAVASAGFHIEEMRERPGKDNARIPSDFIILAVRPLRSDTCVR